MSQEQYFSSQSMITGWWRRGKTKSFMKHSGDKAEEDSGMTALNEARTPFFQPCGGPKKPVCLFSVHVCIFPPLFPGSQPQLLAWPSDCTELVILLISPGLKCLHLIFVSQSSNRYGVGVILEPPAGVSGTSNLKIHMNIVQEPEVWLSTCVASSPNSSLLQVLVVFLRLWNQSLLTGSYWFLVFSLTWSSSARAFPPSTPCTHSSMTRQAFFLVILNPMFCLFRLSIPEITGWWEKSPISTNTTERPYKLYTLYTLYK